MALALSGQAAAATCAPAPPRAKLDASDAAFVGRLVRTERVPGVRDRLDYVFLVDQVVKGELGREVRVRSGIGAAGLGFSVGRDEATGVLLNRDRGLWFGGVCGQVTAGQLAEATRDESAPILNWGGIVVGVLVVGAGLFFCIRQLRRKRYRLAP
jgi:hypothetical protein